MASETKQPKFIMKLHQDYADYDIKLYPFKIGIIDIIHYECAFCLFGCVLYLVSCLISFFQEIDSSCTALFYILVNLTYQIPVHFMNAHIGKPKLKRAPQV